MRSSKRQQQVANSFDIIDDAEISTRIEKPPHTDHSLRHSTRAKISQNVGRVTQPVRRGAETAARKGREGVDAVARRGRQGVDAVTRRSRQGVETLRARSKSVPRVRRSTFQVSKMMRDKPLPKSVFGRKKEKKDKCTEDWRNKMPSSTLEKKSHKERRTSHFEEDDYDDAETKADGDFRRTRSSGSRSGRHSYEEVDEHNEFARTRSSGSHRSERRYYDEETEIVRNRSSGSRSDGRYVVEIDEYC